MNKARVLIVTILLFLSLTPRAQTDGFPAISFKDFQETASPALDSTAHAVVLWEQGRSEIIVHEADRGLRVIHKYGVRIKILDKEGFEKANYTIPLRRIGSQFEYAENIRGYTHTYDGRIQTMAMERNAIFREEPNEYVNLTRFTLPNISEGAIIDIFYDIVSPDIYNFRKWEYQDDIPKLHSQYTAIIPALFEYNVTLRGSYELSDVKTSIIDKHFLASGQRYDCSRLVYTMKDIPAFKEEMYMLAPVNYIAAINFELIQYHSPRGGKQVFTKEWKDVDRELLGDKSFGKQLDPPRDLQRVLGQLIGPDDAELAKAKQVYQYIQRQIRWNRNYGKYSQFGVKDALAQRNGNVGDINLGLIAALRAVGLEAYPIVLSTRQNGLPNSLHPVLSDFNYVIARVSADGQDYFLDASEQHLPFGLLPLRCINGEGRIIYSKKSSEWIKLENHIEATTYYTILGKVDETGQFSGSMTVSYLGLAAFNRRNHIQRFPSLDDFLEDQMDRMTTIRIRDGEVQSLDSLDNPLVEKFTVAIDLSSQLRGDQFNINPIFINRTTQNPFNLEERHYHVDLGSRMREVVTVSIYLPEGYALQSHPQDVSFALPESSASYTYQSHYQGGTLQMRQTMALNKAIYEVEEYFHLKEFFSRIIQHQLVDFVFKEEEHGQ